MTPLDVLRRLLDDCVVRIQGRRTGSGFFVGPGVVVTCAHVAGPTGTEVTVDWQPEEGAPVRGGGTVRHASPLPGGRELAPYPDLAIVDIALSPAAPPARTAWLDDRWPALHSTLVLRGHARVYGPEVSTTSGSYTYRGDYGPMIRLTDDEFAVGMSGAPVLNAATGGVCAVAKATRRTDGPYGGVAVPLAGLRHLLAGEEYRRLWRQHDTYHRNNRLWVETADNLAGPVSGVSRAAERELRGILAGAPAATDPGEHLSAYRRVTGGLAPVPGFPLHDYGDVVTELAQLVNPGDGLPYLLEYAIALEHAGHSTWDGARVELLKRWIRGTAATLGLFETAEERLSGPAPARDTAVSSVLVRIQPSARKASGYRYQVLRYGGAGDVSELAGSPGAEPLDRIRDRLRNDLRDLVNRNAAGPRTMVELIVPWDLLDIDADQWPAGPERAFWRTLGRAHGVVVRDLERFGYNEAEAATWRQRWDALEGRDVGASLRAVSCTDDRGHVAMDAWLDRDGRRPALLLPGSPDRGPAEVAMQVGIVAGVPIMIWRRDGCAGGPGGPHEDCPATRLFSGVRSALAGADRADVPERVRRLRNAAAEDPRHCARQIVVLWDDPDRRPPHRPLAAPEQGGSGG